jgi:DNA modification methylase
MGKEKTVTALAAPQFPNHQTYQLFPMKDIKVLPGRGRKDFGGVLELAESISKFGLIEPVVVDRDAEGQVVLVAGERRFRACCMLGASTEMATRVRETPDHPALPILSGLIPTIFRSQLSPIEKKELELEENLHRKQLEWPEQVELMRQIHELKQTIHGAKAPGSGPEDPGWTLEKTARIANVSPTHLSNQLKLARDLKAHPELREKLAKLPLKAAISEMKRIQDRSKTKQLVDSGKLTYDSNLIQGDARELILKIPSGSIDLIVTDPPFGDTTISEREGQAAAGPNGTHFAARLTPTDNLNPTAARELLGVMIPEMYRVLKPSAHLYMFFSFEHYPFLLETLRAAGFEVKPEPILWYKGRSVTRFQGYEFMNCYEPVFFCHKPPRTKRLNDAEKLVVEATPIPVGARYHPFEKPQELLRKFINLSSNPGDKLLDPFSGSAAVGQAAQELGRSITLFELDPNNFLIGQQRLLKRR